MTKKEMIDTLLSTNNQIRKQVNAKQVVLECLNKKLEIAIEGLEAIEKFGNSNKIATKTIKQIEEISINI